MDEATVGRFEEPYRQLLTSCRLCPRRCGADRVGGEVGECGAGAEARLASATVHIGEEPPISGVRGSGTFFFSHCPLSCVYCQNFPISQLGHGRNVTVPALAERMLLLSRRGAHNINIVTGTPFVPHIIHAVALARAEGLGLPVVWNTSGFETPETIDRLAGTVDIYLTDIKYRDDVIAEKLSGAPGYFTIATEAAKRMLEQVGSLETDARGIGKSGVIIRHLVLPDDLSGTEKVMRFIADHLGTGVHVSLMGQYFPAHRAADVDPLGRPITSAEYERAKAAVLRAGLELGWFQDMDDPTLRRGA